MTKTDFRFAEVHGLLDQVEKGNDKVHFKNIFQTENGGVSLVAFEAGQKLDTHLAPTEIMVTVCEGEIEFTVDGKPNDVKAGQFILLGADVPHSVFARTDAKLMIIKIR